MIEHNQEKNIQVDFIIMKMIKINYYLKDIQQMNQPIKNQQEDYLRCLFLPYLLNLLINHLKIKLITINKSKPIRKLTQWKS